MSGPSCDLLVSERELTDLTARLLAEAKPIGFDIETGYEGPTREKAGLHPEENFITGLSFTNSVTWARYVPLRHESGTNLDPEFTARCFWPLAEAGLLVCHGAKFELRVCSRWFREQVPGGGYFPVRSCTMLEAYAEGTHRTCALKPLTLETFGHQMCELLELFPKLTKKEEDSIRFSVLDQHDPRVIQYACEDAVYALGHHLKRGLGAGGYPAITSSAHPQNYIYRMEMGVLPIVCAMEDSGLRYDWLLMRDGAARGRAFQEKLTAEISADLSRLLGEPVRLNIGSHQQLRDVLYDKLGLATKRRTKSGTTSTDKIALKGLASQHPVVQKVIDWKQLAKLCGTYLEVYEKRFTYAPDGLTHPNHMQHGVPAGRFAVSDPPYQQSPKKYHYELADGTTYDYNFRNGIICPPGYYGFGYDYSQMEVRVLAGEAGETTLIEAFARGDDIHTKTASLMLGIPGEQVTSDQRAVGKTLGLALGYQMGVDGLADRLAISKAEAQELFDQYFAAYPRIKIYLDQAIRAAMRCGYVHTKFGRRVPIWNYDSPYRGLRKDAERLAGNAPIQGGAADYMKIAMIRAQRALDRTGLTARGVHLVMNIHDALEWYVPEAIPPEEMARALAEPGVVDDQPAILFAVKGWPAMAVEWHRWQRWGSATVLKWDGTTLSAVGEKEEEINADEDEIALPKVNLGALRKERDEVHRNVVPGRAGGGGNLPGPAPVGAPRTVIIDAAEPGSEEFLALVAFAREKPGPHTLMLRTPGGTVKFAGTTGITPGDEASVTLLLGPCTMHCDGVAAAVAQGLVL